MGCRLFVISIAISLVAACQTPKADFDKTELIGVWSGLLFQTQSAYDSLVLSPIHKPEAALLYQNGKGEKYELNREGSRLSFRASGGLRFDLTYKNDSPQLFGVLTYNLWSQGLAFSKSGDRWVSVIPKQQIIDTDYQVFLDFYEDSLGRLQAHIQSNKENRELHFKIDSVWLNGKQIDFRITNNRFDISAEFDPIENRILLAYTNAGGTRKVELNKLSPSDLIGYKPLSNQSYAYKIPDPAGQSLETASIEEVGINPSMLNFMPEMNGGRYDHIHSILITKSGKLVFEEYFHGYERETLHDIKSSFKSIASLWLGKAMMQTQRIGLSGPIMDYYPEYEVSDENKRDITIHHALTMSTGLKLENEDEMQWSHPDWVGYKLDLPLAHAPGTTYEYSSGGMNLITGVIQSATEKNLPLYLYDEILLPMDIQRFQMRTSPQGRAYMAGDFYLRPIDLAKFGLLVLQNGKWDNQQIIASDWINTSTRPYIKGSWPKESDYGYLWRLLERKVGGKQMKTIEAWGNGGQFLIIIPEADMAITFTGGNYSLFPEMEAKPFDILETYILPAVEVE